MTSRNYTRPTVDPEWAACRETSHAVAVAIHAIADSRRTPEAIWEDPTPAESDHISMAVAEYVAHGNFPAEDDGVYHWGQSSIVVPLGRLEG